MRLTAQQGVGFVASSLLSSVRRNRHPDLPSDRHASFVPKTVFRFLGYARRRLWLIGGEALPGFLSIGRSLVVLERSQRSMSPLLLHTSRKHSVGVGETSTCVGKAIFCCGGREAWTFVSETSPTAWLWSGAGLKLSGVVLAAADQRPAVPTYRYLPCACDD